jgi:HSF-type DNA-binding
VKVSENLTNDRVGPRDPRYKKSHFEKENSRKTLGDPADALSVASFEAKRGFRIYVQASTEATAERRTPPQSFYPKSQESPQHVSDLYNAFVSLSCSPPCSSPSSGNKMDPNALIASLQQSGAQFTPAQIQQIQNQLQQQQQQQHQPQHQNDVGGSDSNTSVPQLSMPNVPNMNNFFPAPTMAAPQQAPVAPMNVTTNQTANPAFPFALLGASPLQQQLAALSGFPQVQHQQQQQQQLMPNNNDPNALHPKPQAPTAVPNLPVQQPQQMQAWNPQQQLQIQPQPQPFVNPFLPALMPMHLQQQLQQQFLAQQMLQLSGGGGGGNAMAANHLLAALLASQQQQPQPQQQPQHLGAPNPLPNFAAPAPSDTPKGPTDGKSGGEVEWTKPFAGKVKKESPFPMKLYQILSNPECQECICWNPHGRSWRILKPPVFEQVVIPLYFRYVIVTFMLLVCPNPNCFLIFIPWYHQTCEVCVFHASSEWLGIQACRDGK